MTTHTVHGGSEIGVVDLRLETNGVILEVHGDIEALLGQRADVYIGRSALAWIHPEDLAAATSLVTAVGSSPEGSVSFRCRLGDAERGWIPVHCVVSPVTPKTIMSIRMRPSEAYLDREGTIPIDASPPIEMNPLDVLFESPGIDNFLMATATGAVYSSPGLYRIFGMDSTGFFSSFGDLLHPDDSDRMVDLLSRLSTRQDRFVQVAVRALRVDGTWGTFRIRTRDLTEDPDFGIFITVVHELTDDEVPGVDDEVDPRLRHALSLAADPIMVIADDDRVRFASSSTAALLGSSAAEITTRPLTELLLPDGVDAFTSWRSDPAVVSCRLHFSTADGPRWVTARKVDAGLAERSFLVVALRDIDDQVHAEEALKRREARFAALVRNSADGVVVLDEANRVIASGHALEQVLGYRSDLVTGLLLEGWVDPGDQGLIVDALHTARNETAPVTVTVRQRVADGSLRWIQWTVQDHRSSPDIAGVVVNLADRTDEVRARRELEESERRFRAIVDHSFEVTVLADEEFHVMWASPSLVELLAWEADDVIGRSILDFVHPDDLEAARIRYDRALTNDGPEPSIPLRVRSATGGWRHVVVVAADRRDDPDVGGIILNLRDAEEQVASALALAENEKRYRMLVQNSADVVAIVDVEGTLEWVSPTVRNVLGLDPDELIGQPMGGFEDFTGREELYEAFTSVLTTFGASARVIAPLRHVDGTWRWVDMVLTNRLDEPGISGVVAAYRDITERIEADRSRQASEERFRSLAESSPLGIFQLDNDQHCTYVNDRWCEITGLTSQESRGDAWRQPFVRGGNDLDELTIGDGDFTRFDPGMAILRNDGSIRWCSMHIAPIRNTSGERIGSVGTIDDITSTVNARHEASRLSSILESSPDLVLVFTPTGQLVYLNEAARRFFLIGADDSIEGLSAAEILEDENLTFWSATIIPALVRGEVWQGEVDIVNRAGQTIPISAVVNVHRDATGRAEVVSVTARDMTERAELEARLEHQATHDPLTGLPNRSLLLDRLGIALARAKRRGSIVAVLFADLDRFKVVNDGLGHATGDELLTLVARRLEATLRPGDTVARLGGDEFVIVCEDLVDPIEAEQVARRISSAISEPATIDSAEIVVSVSVGITVIGDAEEDPDQMIRDADAAMYLAKKHGRARWEIFDPDLRDRASSRLTLESELRRALQTGQLRLHYQPVVDIRSSRVVGAEALLRWQHPDQGLLAPSSFLEIAEESGLIMPIGEWVLATACNQLRAWTNGDEGFTISVNLSARQIDAPDLLARVDAIITAADVPAERVILEITESTLMIDAVSSGATLAELKGLGVGLAIDDFGTGYSSLAYLQQYPVDVLKIDRSFVSGLGRGAGDDAIVEAIISLADALDLHTTAEGVETDVQLGVLDRLGCEFAQGYLQSPPLSPGDFEKFLAARNA